MIKYLSENWLWIVLVIAFIAMHRSGMGCGMGHGGHRDHHSTGRQDRTTDRPVEDDAQRSLR